MKLRQPRIPRAYIYNRREKILYEKSFYRRLNVQARMRPPRSHRVLASSRPLSLLSPALSPAPPSDPSSFLSLPHIQAYIHSASTRVGLCVRAHVRVCVCACVLVRVCVWTCVIFFLSLSPSLPLSVSLFCCLCVHVRHEGLGASKCNYFLIGELLFNM